MEPNANVKALFIIVNAGHATSVIDVVREVGVKGATILNARGDGARHALFLGITLDPEKEIILTIVDAETAANAMAAIKEKAGIESPAHSVCFSLPVEKTIGFGASVPEAGE